MTLIRTFCACGHGCRVLAALWPDCVIITVIAPATTTSFRPAHRRHRRWDRHAFAPARVAAAHGGDAELIVTLRHGNGGSSEVSLDTIAAAALLDACEAIDPAALTGQSWERVRDALAVSWNRFQQ